MTTKPIPDDIIPPERIKPTSPIGEDQKELATNSQAFASFMQKEAGGVAPSKAQMISPFDLAQQGQRPITGGPNLDTLVAQVQLGQSSMTDLQSQMKYPDLKLKASQKYIMKNKLTDVNDNLRTANAKLGIPSSEPPTAKATGGPLGRYLDYVTDGMNQLTSAKAQLANMKSQGHNLTPADFLLIQIKMNKAQQEIDFTSVLLSKAVEDFKTMMNIQL